MLNFDYKKLTKNLKFNISPGKFKGKKIVIPVHKTKHGILLSSFKLKLGDIIKILIYRRIYLQLVPNGNKTPGVTVDVDPSDFERSISENEDYFEKEKLKKTETKEVS